MNGEERAGRVEPLHDIWESGGVAQRVEIRRGVWEEIVSFVMAGFAARPSGGPEVGGLLLGARTERGMRVEGWLAIPCEHARGPAFELSEQDRSRLRKMVDGRPDVAGWFVSKYWDPRWSQPAGAGLAPTLEDAAVFDECFPEVWQAMLLIQRAKTGPQSAALFFRSAAGFFDVIELHPDETVANVPGSSEPQGVDQATEAASPQEPAPAVDETAAAVTLPEPEPTAGEEYLPAADVVAAAPEPLQTLNETVGEEEARDVAVTHAQPELTVNEAAAEEEASDDDYPGAEEPSVAAEAEEPESDAVYVLTERYGNRGAAGHWNWFGLRHDPFDMGLNPEFVYWSAPHESALKTMLGRIEGRRGITLLTGGRGTGKTLLLSCLGDRLTARGIEFGLLVRGGLTADRFYSMVAYDYGLDVDGGDRLGVLSELRKLGLRQVEKGSTTALLIDEAESVPAEVWEEILHLDSLRVRGDTKLIQIVLAGQEGGYPDLEGSGTSRVELAALSEAETLEWTTLRCAAAGGAAGKIFGPGVIAEIHRRANGIPRAINTICDNALRISYEAHERAISMHALELAANLPRTETRGRSAPIT